MRIALWGFSLTVPSRVEYHQSCMPGMHHHYTPRSAVTVNTVNPSHMMLEDASACGSGWCVIVGRQLGGRTGEWHRSQYRGTSLERER